MMNSDARDMLGLPSVGTPKPTPPKVPKQKVRGPSEFYGHLACEDNADNVFQVEWPAKCWTSILKEHHQSQSLRQSSRRSPSYRSNLVDGTESPFRVTGTARSLRQGADSFPEFCAQRWPHSSSLEERRRHDHKRDRHSSHTGGLECRLRDGHR